MTVFHSIVADDTNGLTLTEREYLIFPKSRSLQWVTERDW